VRRRVWVAAITIAAALCGSAQAVEPQPAYCAGEYAEELSTLAPKARELERQSYSFCVRSTAVYECLSYGGDGGVRRARSSAVQHGTAFAYRRDGSDTLLLTNEHVAEWPMVTDQAHVVDGVPAGCKRVSENLRIVDNEQDGYENDDVVLQRVVSDARLDAAVLRAKTSCRSCPGRSAARRRFTSATSSKCAASRLALSKRPTSAR
jgi:serine protease Do